MQPEAALTEAQAPPVTADPNDWIPLSEAATILGISRDAIYQRIKSGRFGEENITWRPSSNINGNYKPMSVSKVALTTMPRKMSGGGGPRKAATTKPSTQPIEVQPAPTTLLAHHIAFGAGHCMAYLEMYAAGQEMPARQLVTGVAEVLKRGGK